MKPSWRRKSRSSPVIRQRRRSPSRVTTRGGVIDEGRNPTVQLDAGINHVVDSSPHRFTKAVVSRRIRGAESLSLLGFGQRSAKLSIAQAEIKTGLRSVELRRSAGSVGQELHLRRERNSDFRQGSERYSLRQLPQPGDARALSPDSDSCARRQHEHGARMGWRHLRERRFLRHLRRAWPDGLAGVHLRRRHGSRRPRIPAERARGSDAAGKAAARSSQHRSMVRQ